MKHPWYPLKYSEKSMEKSVLIFMKHPGMPPNATKNLLRPLETSLPILLIHVENPWNTSKNYLKPSETTETPVIIPEPPYTPRNTWNPWFPLKPLQNPSGTYLKPFWNPLSSMIRVFQGVSGSFQKDSGLFQGAWDFERISGAFQGVQEVSEMFEGTASASHELSRVFQGYSRKLQKFPGTLRGY